MRRLTLTLLAAACTALASAHAQSTTADPDAQSQKVQQAVDERIRLERRVAAATAPIKSLADLYAHLHDGTKGMAALEKLPADAQRIFISSLTFNEKGLTGFNFQILEDSLRVEEAYDLLSLFGFQHTVGLMPGLRADTNTDLLIQQAVGLPPRSGDAAKPNYEYKGYDDHSEYECIRPATGQSAGGRICTSNC